MIIIIVIVIVTILILIIMTIINYTYTHTHIYIYISSRRICQNVPPGRQPGETSVYISQALKTTIVSRQFSEATFRKMPSRHRWRSVFHGRRLCRRCQRFRGYFPGAWVTSSPISVWDHGLCSNSCNTQRSSKVWIYSYVIIYMLRINEMDKYQSSNIC